MKNIFTNYKIFLSISACLLFVAPNLQAQDIHFSQFNQAPLLINPAMTGLFNGDQRAFVHYRNQWQEFAPFKTYSLSVDAGLMKKKMKKKYIGAGLYIFQDIIGNSNMKTTQVHLSISSIIEINKEQAISAGLRGGFGQNSMDESNLQWGTNYTSMGYMEGSSGEEGRFENFGFGDFSAGLTWNYGSSETNISKNNHFGAKAGIALFHINAPSQGDFEEKLKREFVAHGSAYIGLAGTPLALLPSAILLVQGDLKQIHTGALLRYMIREESKYTGFLKETSASLGMYYRVGDAIIPTFRLEYGNYSVGISYDINTSPLKEASNGKGGMEISLKFVNPNPFKYGRGTNYTPML